MQISVKDRIFARSTSTDLITGSSRTAPTQLVLSAYELESRSAYNSRYSGSFAEQQCSANPRQLEDIRAEVGLEVGGTVVRDL